VISQPVGVKIVSSAIRSPMRINAPLSSDSSTCHLQLHRPTGQGTERVGQLRPLGVLDRRRRPDEGDPPAPGLAVSSTRKSRVPTMSRARPPVTAKRSQRKAGGWHLALEQLRDQTLACRHVQFTIGQGGAQGRRGGHDPGEAEQVVLERLQLAVVMSSYTAVA
jgi:hypothetical protein